MKFTLRLSLLFVFALFFAFKANAQRYTIEDFSKIDSLAQEGQPKTALELVNKFNEQARANGDSQMLIKSVVYRMLFQSYLEEDSFDKILTNLKKDIELAKQPEKSILQSLLAEIYWRYYQQNSYKIANRTNVAGDIGDDIKTWPLQKITNEIVKYYLLSLTQKELLQNTKIDEYNKVLSGNTYNRNLRPTLYDLLAHRAIDVFINTQLNLLPVNDQSIDFSNPVWSAPTQTFLATEIPKSDSTSFYLEAMQLFKNLSQLHYAKQNAGALADVELQRLKFVHQQNNDAEKTELYYTSLQRLANESRNTEIYADILFEQAQLHKNAQLQVDSNKLNLIKAHELASLAIKAYPNSQGAGNSTNLIKQIKAPEQSIKIKGLTLPEKPALFHLSYKNLDTIYLKLYQKGASDLQEYFNLDSKTAYDKYFTGKKVIKEWMLVLPKATDYQTHTLIDKMDGLSLGNYLLLAGDKKKSEAINYSSYINFRVSALAVTDRGVGKKHEYIVRSAINGLPLKKVKIQQKKSGNRNDLINGELLETDEKGFATTEETNNIYRALVIDKKDTLALYLNNYNYRYGTTRTKRIILFTDRPIYRPGQQVYYKGLFIENGESESQILPHEEVELTFKDANYKEIEKREVTTNEYGTFQGVFTIPTGKLNGRMQLSTPYGSISVQVEEYKRPTFEVVFDKSDQKYKLNDSVKIKGTALAYAGYAISGAKVKYKVVRRDNVPDIYYRYQYSTPKQVAIGQTTTKDGGLFDFSFFAKANNTNINYTYEVTVEITDINGETRTNSKSINVGKKDIQLAVNLPEQLFLNSKPDSVHFSISNLNNEPIKATLQAEWSLLQAPARLTKETLFNAEKYSLSREDFIRLFPYDDYNEESKPVNWPVKNIALKQTTTSDKGNLSLPAKELPAGFYKVKFTAINQLNDTVSLHKIVRIYPTEPIVIQNHSEWLIAEKTKVAPGEDALFRIAALTTNSKGYYEVYQKDSIIERTWVNLSPKQSIVKIKANPSYGTNFAVQFTLVQDGTTYNSLQSITIVDPSKQLDIKFLTFRNKLQPGEKESWKLQISNKNGEKEMAELVATLYDASLNDLKKMSWQTAIETNYNYQNYNWSLAFNNLNNSDYFWFTRPYLYFSPINRSYENLNFFGYDYYGNYNYTYHSYINNLANKLRKKSSEQTQKALAELAKGSLLYGVVTDKENLGLPSVKVQVNGTSVSTNQLGIYSIKAKAGDVISIRYIGFKDFTAKVGKNRRLDITLQEDGNALNEVVVTAYGAAQQKKSVTGSVTTLQAKELAPPVASARAESSVVLRGIATQPGDKYNDSLKQDVTDVAKEGGLSVLGQSIVPRTNFNETAFFYPQLHTNEKGEIDIEFTIPQSLTRYQMMGFAHTKDLKTATISNELVTQKQLAISANAPRFFREGDTIILSAKLNNLSGSKLKGQATLELRDALTGKIIQIAAPQTLLSQPFEIANAGNEAIKWPLIIPAGLSAITYKVLAQAGRYSDGEEMTIPVLPNSMLVTESMPLNVRGNSTKVFNMEKLLKSGSSNTLRHQALTFEFTSNPVWYAVQALPYLMEYPYECAEQTFSRFYANSFATGIINSSPKIKQVFEQWQQAKNGEALLSNLEKNQELKSILLEETPWVRQAENETERKKRLAVLFDLNRMTYELKSNFEKLEKMQRANGAFPWFTGMNEDRYITQHIVLGMGQLKRLKLVDEKSYPNFNTVLSKAVSYLDAKLVEDYKKELNGNGTTYLPLHYLYARSYSSITNKNTDFIKAHAFYLKRISENWLKMDSYQLAQAALVLHRNGNPALALKIINLLKQTAQQNEEMGMYWANNKSGWWWYQNPIETQAILIEAFDEVAADTKSVEEMKIWLLKNKQTNDWKTTKATAAACYALLMRGYNLLADSAEPGILIGNKTLSDLGFTNAPKEAGTGYQKVSITGNAVQPEMGKVEIKNNNQTVAWGALYWQYFEQLDKITPAATGVKINKKLFLQKQTDKGDILTPLTEKNTLSPGDLLKVRVEIYVDRDMQYVHLKDMRSSGFEPVNVISQYKYQDGLGYYESTKDASTNFFIGYLPKGTYVFEYPLRVSHSGNFSNGITSLQCMYAPEFATHSQGIRVSVK